MPSCARQPIWGHQVGRRPRRNKLDSPGETGAGPDKATPPPGLLVLVNFALVVMVLGTVGTVYFGLGYARPRDPSVRSARIQDLDPRRNPADRAIIDSDKPPEPPRSSRGPSLHVRRGLLLSVALLAAGLGIAFLGATQEHLEPIVKARRNGLPPPRQEILKALHNLAMALAMVIGVAGATGYLMAEGAQSPYRDLRIPAAMVLLAAVAALMALQRWTPFANGSPPGYGRRRPPGG